MKGAHPLQNSRSNLALACDFPFSITLDIYSHLFRGDHRHHVNRLDDSQMLSAKTKPEKIESATQAQPLLNDENKVLPEVIGL